MLKFIIYVLFFYFLYNFFRRTFSTQDNSNREKIRSVKKDNASHNIDEKNIVDAKFKEIKKEE